MTVEMKAWVSWIILSMALVFATFAIATAVERDRMMDKYLEATQVCRDLRYNTAGHPLGGSQ